MLTLRRGWTRFFPLRCGSSAGGNLGYAARAINKLTPVAPPEDVMRPWRTPSPRTRYRLHHRCRWTEIARQLMDPGQGVSCWAKHCADPAPDRHTALRRFPKRRTQGVVSPTGRECQFLRGARIPHAVCENTTRVGPRRTQLLRECAKNAQLGARAW